MMMSRMIEYNPDVLSSLADLLNDKVFSLRLRRHHHHGDDQSPIQ